MSSIDGLDKIYGLSKQPVQVSSEAAHSNSRYIRQNFSRKIIIRVIRSFHLLNNGAGRLVEMNGDDMDDLPDRFDLVEQLLCQECGSVEGFLIWYRNWFAGIAYRHRLPYSEWEDLAQEILRTAFDQMRRGLYRHDGSLPAWLRQIAKGKIADYWRQPELSSATLEIGHYVEDNEEIGPQPNRHGSPLDQLLVALPSDAGAREIVQRALSSLSNEEEMVLILNAHHGFTIVEISHILGIPMGTVGRRLRDAKNNFKRIVVMLSR
jgi:RNA polymerase sigma factor (sigma-70 family)